MARCSQKYWYYCSILLLVSGGREHLPCFCLCSQSCQLWSALGLHSEKKEQAKGECCLEVGHVHSAFVKSDSSINHVRGSVDAQWLRSAGGISLWMPEHQPRWSTRVPSLLVPQSFAALRRLSLQAVLPHPTPKFHQFKKMLKACSRVCPTLSSYHFFFSLPFFSVISVSFQHISPLFFFFFSKSAGAALAISQFSLHALTCLESRVSSPTSHRSLHSVYFCCWYRPLGRRMLNGNAWVTVCLIVCSVDCVLMYAGTREMPRNVSGHLVLLCFLLL